MAQLFISYRSSDGKDKATALARDLGAVFGDEQVFLDKDDLSAGGCWRTEIAQTIQSQPILLLLLTPQLLAATDQDGRLRIADPEDPVRRELAEALQAGAHIIPLLCDGLEKPPDTATLPAPFNRFGEFTWRPLRAYDWQHDLGRLVDDLRALGLPPVGRHATTPEAAPEPARRPARWRLPVLTAAVLLATAGGWYALRSLAPQTTTTSTTRDLSGEWLATQDTGANVTLSLRQSGDALLLNSRPVPISGLADWADYRRFWRERSASELNAIAYRGQGKTQMVPEGGAEIDIGLEIVSSPGGELIDTGNLHASVNADGTAMDGRLWLNSEQAERRVHLTRAPRAK